MPLPAVVKSDIERHRKVAAAGRSQAPGVGTDALGECPSTPGRHLGAGVGHGDTNAIVSQRPPRMKAGRAKVCAIKDDARADAANFRFVDGDLHGFLPDHRTHDPIGVDQRQSRRFFDYVHFRTGLIKSFRDAVVIAGQPTHALPLPGQAAQFAIHQTRAAVIRFFRRQAHCYEGAMDKVFQVVNRYLDKRDAHRSDAPDRLVLFEFFRCVDLHEFKLDAAGFLVEEGDIAFRMRMTAGHLAGTAFL